MGARSSKLKSKQVGSRKKTKVNQTESLQAHHEIQVSEGGEADLFNYLADCPKNPGHKKFTPVNSFRMEDLPAGYRDIDLYELIKATADLTVRVEVRMTSPDRPEFYPDTNVPYPFFDMRNITPHQRILGTGQIGVWKFIAGRGVNVAGGEYNVVTGKKYSSHFEKSTRTCPCTKCQHSNKPNNVWWEIIVVTATHVVFDDIEARHTSCRLFYDEKNSPVVSLDKLSVSYVNCGIDWCQLKYVTCDSLGDKLYKMTVYWWYLWMKVWNKYRNKSCIKLTYIVSHPHGCHKQVSIGHLMKTYKYSEYKKFDLTKLTYKTCTCPGSSGARVHCVGSTHVHVHAGALNSVLNCSGLGLYYRNK